MSPPRRLLTISHSYVVDANRRFAHELSRVGGARWEVTAVAPTFLDTDLRPVSLEAAVEEPSRLETLPVHLSRWIHLMFYGRRLREILASPWDMVHCWEEPFILAGAQVAYWTPEKIPLVFRSYQNIDKRYPPPFSWMENYCVKRCAGWQAAGVEVAETLLRRGYGRKPHRFIPDGVDVEAFSSSPEARETIRRGLGFDTPGPPVVGTMSRFVTEKGLRHLTSVLDGLSSPWRALFVGEGPLEPELRRWAARYPNRARIVTGVRHAEVPAYLNAMDIACVLSQTTPRWREQFGRATIEAFACGVPVIGSDSGEIPHILSDAGIVVGEKDAPALNRALTDLLENPARRRELGRLGRDRAMSRYAWPVVAKQNLDFFSELLENR